MGYYADIIDADFTLKRENYERFMQLVPDDIIKELKAYNIDLSPRGVLDYLGFDMNESDGGIDSIWPGYDSKYISAIERVFTACAPAISPGHIDYIGEDQCIWRLKFTGTEMDIVDGHIVFEDDYDDDDACAKPDTE